MNSEERDVSRTQSLPRWPAAIHCCFLSLLARDAFALLCMFVARMSVSELTQLNAVGCGGEGVNNQNLGRRVVGSTVKSLQRCC